MPAQRRHGRSGTPSTTSPPHSAPRNALRCLRLRNGSRGNWIHGVWAAVVAISAALSTPAWGDFRVLAFSKTTGFRHAVQIEAGEQALSRLGQANGFSVDFSDDGQDFNALNLATYEVVVFLFTSGDILDTTQEQRFEEFVLSGGGFVGIHSASDTEFDWVFYGDLLGAYFSNHPAIQDATVRVVDGAHPSTSHLAASFSHSDEWYNFDVNPAQNPDLEILLEVDESTYSGGQHGASHPVAWTRSMGSGRAWYTAMGHTLTSDADYENSFFDQHLLGGIESVVPVPESRGPFAIAVLWGTLWTLARTRSVEAAAARGDPIS